ncbi:mitochondrial carrier, partial [Jaminaea rosea]
AYVTSATYASAGLANMISATSTNPFDVVKLRQQLLLEKERANFLSVARGMLGTEGVKGLWAGVTAACLREATYGTIRMGGYEPFKRLYTSTLHLPESSFALKLLAGVSSGTIGCLLSSPTDLMKVRMQAVRDPAMGHAPPYRSTLRGFVQVYREEGGIKGLWRGVGPNVARAGILTASQVGTYDQTKWWLKGHLGWGEGGRLHVAASMVAGLVCSLASSPVDVIKVRVMNVAADSASHESALTLLNSLLRTEGPLALWKGFGMCWARLGTHTTISLVLFEYFRGLLGIKPL